MLHTKRTEQGRGSILWLVLAGLLSGGVSHGAGADSGAAKEHQIKAAFVYNFLKFVEWPEAKLGDTNSALTIGVIGKGPMTAELQKTVKDRRINGRELVVKTIETPEAARTTHLLYVTASEDSRLSDWLAQIADASILTVGESEEFAKRGGIMTFVLEGDKLRFEINIDAAEAAKLRISAQLQKLAKTIRRKP